MTKPQRRMLAALLLLANNKMEVKATMTELAKAAGYSEPGGTLSYALIFLEHENKITKVGDDKWLITL